MSEVLLPLWASLVSVPLLLQFGVGFSLVPRAPERWRPFILPSASILVAMPLAWLFFRVLLVPLMTWFMEGVLVYLLVYAVRLLLQRFFSAAMGASHFAGSRTPEEGDHAVHDAFPWLAVWLSLSLSWSFLTAFLAVLGCIASLLLASLFIRLVEWRTDLEHRIRGGDGMLLRLVIALLLVFFQQLLAFLLFPAEIL